MEGERDDEKHLGKGGGTIDKRGRRGKETMNGETVTYASLGKRALASAIDLCGNAKQPQTRMICTLGPSVADVDMLTKLIEAGMNIARFNFSHGTIEYHQNMYDKLMLAVEKSGKKVAVALDTKGPEIRTGFLENHEPVTLEKGTEITITTDYTVAGTSQLLALSYKKLPESVHEGSKILLADGTAVLTVLSTNAKAGTVRARVENTAKIGEKKNCNLPGVKVDLDILTASDKDALVNFAIKNEIDFVFASFIQSAADVEEIRAFVGKDGRNLKIISKIESQLGILNFEEILSATDGVMVARGDLGMEIPLQTVFLAQKMMIRMCNLAAKPVVTATQMLESMVTNPRPTRAEATDVANAVLDGTDVVMLSGETAGGAFPIQAAETMRSICVEAESCEDSASFGRQMASLTPAPMSVLESAAFSAVKMAEKTAAALIIVLAASGGTARLISKYHPSVPVIVAVVPVGDARIELGQAGQATPETVYRSLLVSRGLIPYLVDEHGTTNGDDAKKSGNGWGLCRSAGDDVVDPGADEHPSSKHVLTPEKIIAHVFAYAKAEKMVTTGDNAVVMHATTKGATKFPVLQVLPCQ